MNLRLKLSLKLKIFLGVGLFYLAAVGTLTYLTIRSQRNSLLAQMRERAKVGINLMELSVSGALYKLDTYRLETIASEAKALPNVNPNNPKFAAMSSVWRRLPLPIANVAGPLLARHLA